jgi:lipopolysaccharide transport system ATP-binding protein
LNNDPIISLENVGVRFKIRKSLFYRDYFEAIKDVSLNIRKGESLGIVGRNGAGKTTLLQILGGIIRPDRGRIINHNVSTALLALQVGFDLELSGRFNAIICGMLLGFRKKEVKANMEEIIAFSELADFIDRPVKSYSAGMKARLGFSIALNMSPDVLLIDEVLAVGDASFREKSMEVMTKKLLSDQTIVFVSHNGPTVKKFCSRVIWIENGVTQMEGNATDVVGAYEDYLKEVSSRR